MLKNDQVLLAHSSGDGGPTHDLLEWGVKNWLKI